VNIYDAIMKAADTIEKTPHLYNFQAIRVHDCNTPQCMLGWIGHYLGMEGARVYGDVMGVLGLNKNANISIGHALGYNPRMHGDYVASPKAAAELLRYFAHRFETNRVGIPGSVREIFTHPRQTISDTAPDQRFA